MLAHLAEHLHGKTVIVGIGNTLRSDDGAGSLLAARIKDKTSFQVFDTGSSPENYLGKIIREKPDTIILVDCV
ncbi:MAG: hydrogenase maturation protease, partial [Candidatus Omnitrophica bacterium]|nr:hydrogenase maturation protease [Candidatus Omnitrophota bacterium]